MGVKVRQRPKNSGIWYLVIDHKGERRSKKVGPNKKKAEEIADIVRANLLLGKPLLKEDAPKVPTLNEYYARFKERYMKTAIKESSYTIYESVFRVHTLPELGKLRLDQIDRDKIEDFISVLMMEKDLAKDSIRVILGSLRVLLNNAIEKKLIKENPVSKVGKLYSQAPVRHEEIEPLNVEESIVFLKAALKYEPEHYPLFFYSLNTGVRSGEAIALQWDDIDWNGKFIQIRRQVVLGKLTTLKTKHGKRKVDCSDELLAVLAALKSRRQEEALKKGSNEISEWVFANEKGERIDIGNIKTRYFKRVLRKAGLREIRYHDLRHSYASQLLAQGEPVTYVSQQLGHANAQITFRVYAHWIPNKSQQQAVNRLPSLNQFSNALENSQAQIGRK